MNWSYSMWLSTSCTRRCTCSVLCPSAKIRLRDLWVCAHLELRSPGLSVTLPEIAHVTDHGVHAGSVTLQSIVACQYNRPALSVTPTLSDRSCPSGSSGLTRRHVPGESAPFYQQLRWTTPTAPEVQLLTFTPSTNALQSPRPGCRKLPSIALSGQRPYNDGLELGTRHAGPWRALC
nr:hypothetical protein CFP56_00788 [Quercus suber]